MARRFVSCVMALATGLALPLFLLLVDVEAVAYHLPVYRESLAANDAPAATGLSIDQLDWTIRRTLDYATGRSELLQYDRASLDGGPPGRPAFSPVEIEHMADVRALFGLGATCRQAALIVFVLCAAAVAFLDASPLARLGRGLLQGAVVFLTAGAGLTLAIVAGFSSFWTTFHEVLFANDLWCLPAGSLLIEMLPESLFQRLALEVVGLLGVELAIVLGLSLWFRRTARVSPVRRSPASPT